MEIKPQTQNEANNKLETDLEKNDKWYEILTWWQLRPFITFHCFPILYRGEYVGCSFSSSGGAQCWSGVLTAIEPKVCVSFYVSGKSTRPENVSTSFPGADKSSKGRLDFQTSTSSTRSHWLVSFLDPDSGTCNVVEVSFLLPRARATNRINWEANPTAVTEVKWIIHIYIYIYTYYRYIYIYTFLYMYILILISELHPAITDDLTHVLLHPDIIPRPPLVVMDEYWR